MTDRAPETPDAAPAKPEVEPRYRVQRGGFFSVRLAPEVKPAARALYESTPGATLDWVHEQLGGKVPVSTLRRWKAEGGWKPVAKVIADLPGRAGQLANTFKLKMSDLGKPLSDEVAASEVERELAVSEAVNIRAAVIDRHRKEWSVPRKLIYEAVQKRDLEQAKLAKIAGETLQIVQLGECRAFNITPDAKGADGGTTILVERADGGGQPAHPQVPAKPDADGAEVF